MARLIAAACRILTATLASILLLAMVAAAQSHIIGVVASGKTPVVGASVFLNNATYGTTTQADGAFALRNVKPGQYQLVVTSVGYQEYTQTIMVGEKTLNLTIDMQPKVTELREVVIMSPSDRKRLFAMFREDFIGNSPNSKKCQIINPDVVYLSYKGSKKQLKAYSDEFLVVENKALGYRVKYLINDFQSDKLNGFLSYQGRALFEELPGSASQKKKWRQNREDAYYGSPKHFFRALYTNTFAQDGFVVRPFMRDVNPERPTEELIQKKISQFKTTNRDSAAFWVMMENTPKYYHERLGDTLTLDQMFTKTDSANVFALAGGNYLLYVVYTKRHDKNDFVNVYRPLTMENFETSIITMPEPFVFFDTNGRVLNNYPVYEGAWTQSKLAEMLPLDYQPGD